LIDACNAYAKINGELITFEYVMLNGVNDAEKQAHDLVALLANTPAKINLIPFNPFPGSDYTCSSKDTINRFRDILVKGGMITVTRKTRGDDIDAACGQLVGKVVPKAKRHQKSQQNK